MPLSALLGIRGWGLITSHPWRPYPGAACISLWAGLALGLFRRKLGPNIRQRHTLPRPLQLGGLLEREHCQGLSQPRGCRTWGALEWGAGLSRHPETRAHLPPGPPPSTGTSNVLPFWSYQCGSRDTEPTCHTTKDVGAKRQGKGGERVRENKTRRPSNLVCTPQLSSSAHREDIQVATKDSIMDRKRNAG